MRRGVQDREGRTLGTIADTCLLGTVVGAVVDDTLGRSDPRPPEDRVGTISVTLPLIDAITLPGQRVAIFVIEG